MLIAMMTVDEIVDALGGTSAVADKLGMSRTRVSNWRSFGRFPDSLTLYRQISDMCAANNIELDARLFEARRTAGAA